MGKQQRPRSLGQTNYNMENIDNDNFKRWFKNSKAVNPDGTPMVLYHQTNKDNEESIKAVGFEYGRGRAILSDNGVPNGFFFKPSDDDIGVGGGSTQIPVYLSMQNPLVVNNRRELLMSASKMDINVYEADHQFYLMDTGFNNRFKELDKEIKINRETYRQRSEELDSLLDEWGETVEKYAANIRELITNALIKNNYDGVILKNDTGSFNRNVTSYIVFKPEQIKSIHNNGDFNPNEKSIMKEKELNEQLRRIKNMMGLNEALTDEVYHFTHLSSLYNIFKTNEFITTAAVATSSDMVLNKGKFFFFSTTRSNSTGYVMGHAKLVLDGRKLNQRYKGVAVDYWQSSKNRNDYLSDQDYKQALLNSEMEDRIVTNEPTIPKAMSYIKAIHILIGKYERIGAKKLEYFLTTAKENNIPIYFYDVKQNWLLQNKNGLVNPYKGYTEITNDADDYDDYRGKNDLMNYAYVAALIAFNDEDNYKKIISLIGSDNVEKFNELYKNEVYKHLRKNATYEDETVFLYKDYVSRIRSGYGETTRKILKLLSDDMRKLGVDNIKDYINKKREL
jgi:hypothetical protein